MKRNSTPIKLFIITIIICFLTVEVYSGDPVFFSGTGHWYQAIQIPTSICWTQCRDSASVLGGHLATVGSAEENDFLVSLNADGQAAYIGGYEPNNDGTWLWVTGETWGIFTNWDAGEPNNSSGFDDYVEIYNSSVPYPRTGKWNDTYDCALRTSFVIEYENACMFGDIAPELDAIGLKSVEEGNNLTFGVYATDVDPCGDSIILEAENLPANSAFVDSGNGAGSFSFNPDFSQEGNHYLLIIATDSSHADTELVVISVNNTCLAVPGDVNGTPPIALPDVIHLVNYVFDKDRPATGCLGSDPTNCWTPNPLCQGEVNGTLPIGLPDVIYLVNYVFDKDRPDIGCLGSEQGNCWVPTATERCCLPLP